MRLITTVLLRLLPAARQLYVMVSRDYFLPLKKSATNNISLTEAVAAVGQLGAARNGAPDVVVVEGGGFAAAGVFR